jgi:hypothetical protein
MDGEGHNAAIFARITAVPHYPGAVAALFPKRHYTVTRALAAFRRRPTSFDRPHGRFAMGATRPRSPRPRKHGEQHFPDRRFESQHRHAGPLPTDNLQTATSP